MPNLAFFHLRDTTNIGDCWCSPFDQHNWTQIPTFRVQAGDTLARSTDHDMGIFGGGKILASIANSSAWPPKYRWDSNSLRTSPLSLNPGQVS